MTVRLLAALAALCWSALAAAQMPSSDTLFAATLTGLDGKPQALAQWRGKPLIVNFWARWCPPCRVEIPDLALTYQRNRARGLVVLGIGVEDQAEPVRDFAKAYEMDYPLLLGKDKAMELMRALGNSRMGLPFTIAIDRSGKVVAVHTGGMNGEQIAAMAKTAMQ